MRISDWSSDVCSSDLKGGKAMLGTTGCVCGSKLGTTIRLVCEGNRLSDIKFIKQRHPSGAFVDLHREMRCLFGSDLLGRLANQFLFDASGFTRTAAQIVKFSTAYIATRSEEHTSELQSLMRISYA